MGMTVTEKILAAHAGKDKVVPGELVNVKVDLALGNDITAPVAIKEFSKIGVDSVFDREKIALVLDHFIPAKDIASAEQGKAVKNFAQKHGIVNFFDVGKMGIEHCLLPEQGLVGPGDLVIGADSHTCTYGGLGAFSTGVGSTDLAAAMALGETWLKVPESMLFVFEGELRPWVGGKDLILHIIGDIGVDGALYKAMEFAGPAIEKLSMDGRLTMANMAIEAGGKNGIVAPDEITRAYVEGRVKKPYTFYKSDADAVYSDIRRYDASKIEPLVAFPHLPENTRPVSQAGLVELDQVVIGSCTNGRMEDLRLAAGVLKGKKVSDRIRLIVIPGTQQIYKQAMREGLIEIFIDAGGAVSTPTCGPCLGGYMGILAKGERSLATTNRNFVGRMGSPESEVYLCNPAVAAASAILGRIAGPWEVE
ncbi:3-isopropylmalate dehydratase, large subunit [Desulfofarcimen acetoxidans DSM 771]|uniref:3-isopropylmalate dehydratase large subunit n=1 Tax=Desulfofarcimen acetoxidans (strain ATCC 49208 / DSM 771 / KCTC 5769 / VKM B-1644 / 5575) TaxID=485916 RepID=C8W661_DESAS|nr:3-isopropylmalate dehydratase large subunit [Desulfofarcimen acetoxidans]ACV61516.1 3-isopropylmalate dehydratase, large subunit [Desulfofarcimen acetoxidans DSM 771]